MNNTDFFFQVGNETAVILSTWSLCDIRPSEKAVKQMIDAVGKI